MTDVFQPGSDVGRLINLIPVGLKEAAIDSPTARATVVHYTEQVDLLERWLEEYMRVTNRLVAESSTLEGILNSFTSHALVPTTISEAMLDHDYDVLAMKRYSEGAKDYWMSMVSVVKRLSPLVVEPIRQFLQHDLRAFKESRRAVEFAQKNFDNQHTRYASLGKSREPSSLREEAFQLHETRKAYLRASLDFFTLAPQFRFSLDKLLVRIFCDQWKEMRLSRDNTAAVFQRGAGDMDRVKGWLSTMEESEKTFRRELHGARKQLEDTAESALRPSRELEDYSVSTVAQYGHAHNTSMASVPRSPRKPPAVGPEKQGWLYLRTYGGRPTRALWTKRWSVLRNGVFGWLVQGLRAGGVEESERIGVLLCSARAAVTEERRFCFEIKTTKHTIVLQAETQSELQEWLSAFEVAKSKALEDPASLASLGSPGLANSDPAFAITNPPVPEFGAAILAATEPGAAADDAISALDRTGSLPVPGNDHGRDASVDVPRRSTAVEEPAQRDHASRIISKLDLHRKASPSTQFTPSPSTPVGGGIASLIAASHVSMNVGGALPSIPNDAERQRAPFTLALRDMPPSTLAPSTLANVPAPTNMSKSAVLVAGERGLSAAADKGGIPNALLANMWGSSNMAWVNRLDRSDPKVVPDSRLGSQMTPLALPSASPEKTGARREGESSSQGAVPSLDIGPPVQRRARSQSPAKRHRTIMSTDTEGAASTRSEHSIIEFPNYYPLQLKTQDAQFRLLFPTVQRDERLVLVFRATWSPNDQQDFPGRIYVTSANIYFYSNHLGLVLTSTVSLASIDEATAAPGRECDFIFLHMKETTTENVTTRITVKTFLEPLRLLQRRMDFLIHNSVAANPLPLEGVIKTLLKMESEAPERSPSLESWEDVGADTPVDAAAGQKSRRGRSSTIQSELRAPTRVDRNLYNTSYGLREPAPKFKLPAQPVKYTPPGDLRLAAEREFDVSPKALFHVMFGDRSALWQLLQHEKRASNVQQGPWVDLGESKLRRDFEYQVMAPNLLGQERPVVVRDYQVVDVNSDHLCYVVTDKATPWHLPFQDSYRLVNKIVITHVAKGKCKLAVFVRVEWLKEPWALKGMIGRQAMHDQELDAADLVDLVADQVRKLGAHSRTKKAVNIFGQVGQSTEVTQLVQGEKGFGVGIEWRRMPTTRTVSSLLAQNVASAGESALGMLLDGVIGLVRWLGKTLVANKVLILALVLSGLWNAWFTSREGWVWWQERRAVTFMARMGVKPEYVMGKAVYLSDIEELVGEEIAVAGSGEGVSTCYEVFAREQHLYDLDAPLGEGGRGKALGARRMQRTRRELGRYRHELLVAMRMVNSVEKEVVRSEWEGWVDGERRRCKHVKGLLEKGKVNETQLEDLGVSAGECGGLDRWFEEYCTSCQVEHERLAAVL